MKKKLGQPPKKPNERKSITTSVRMTPPNEKKLIKKYGSVQRFFDNCLKKIAKFSLPKENGGDE